MNYIPPPNSILTFSGLDGENKNIPIQVKILDGEIRLGGRGVLVPASKIDDNRNVLVKFPRLDFENYSAKQNQERLLEIEKELENERKICGKLETIPVLKSVTPNCIGTGIFICAGEEEGVSYSIHYLVIEDLGGESLEKWCLNNFSKNGVFNGIIDFSILKKIISQLCEIFYNCHFYGIVHADIWAKNIIVCETNEGFLLKIIDFGQSFSRSVQPFNHPIDDKSHHYLAPERLSINKNGEDDIWHIPVDIFSLCGTIFWLITGNAPPLTFSIEEHENHKKIKFMAKHDTKKELYQIFKQKNEILYQEYWWLIDVVHLGLRPKPEDRSTSVGRISRFFDVCTEMSQNLESQNQNIIERASSNVDSLRNISGCLDLILNEISTCRSNKDGIAIRWIQSDLINLKERINLTTSSISTKNKRRTTTPPIYRSIKDRKDLIDIFTSIFVGLKPGDCCYGLTSQAPFLNENFGRSGRFLSFLTQCALNGIKIKWLILAEQDDINGQNDIRNGYNSNDPNSFSIQKSYFGILKWIDLYTDHANEINQRRITLDLNKRKGFGFEFQFKILELSAKDNESIRMNNQKFIAFEEKQGEGSQVIHFDYTKRHGNVVALHLDVSGKRWSEKGGLQDNFEKLFEHKNSRTIKDFLFRNKRYQTNEILLPPNP